MVYAYALTITHVPRQRSMGLRAYTFPSRNVRPNAKCAATAIPTYANRSNSQGVANRRAVEVIANPGIDASRRRSRARDRPGLSPIQVPRAQTFRYSSTFPRATTD